MSVNQETQTDFEEIARILKNVLLKKIAIVTGGVTLGVVGVVAAAPLAVAAVGFASGGIVSGSIAASLMSFWGAATPAAGLVATLQSVGATGTVLGSAAAAATAGGVGAGIGGGVGAAAQCLIIEPVIMTTGTFVPATGNPTYRPKQHHQFTETGDLQLYIDANSSST